MKETVGKSDKEEVAIEVEVDYFSEHLLIKYILTTIPIYLSFVFFIFSDSSFLDLLKIMAGYTAVFSLFILNDEKTYFLIKENINQIFKNTSLVLFSIFIGLVILHFSDTIFTNSNQISFINLGIFFNPIITFLNKLMWSSFLLTVTYYLNICILTLLIKFDVVNKIITRFSEKNNHNK
ncbi:hypothetical protein [Lysinibacillus fusiformis]|uniref:hypothetical protein n=1 Tax=Lysinibacillus fusiformis TaxID=28031 RepID=UPI0020BEA787|nr:hypothetical protein [Lysinibacillus fusiformis]